MIIRIGKASDNDFVVNDPHVSRYHAKLVREEGGYWLLEDLGSTNGTFVNGAQIVKKHVTPSDTIKLGDNYVLNISEALKSNNDYSEEFAVLKQIYDDYIQAKVKIQSSNQFKTRLFQSLPFALPGVVGVVIGFLGKGSPELFGLSLFITICAHIGQDQQGCRHIVRTELVYHDLRSDGRYLSGCETISQNPTVVARFDQSIQNRLCLPQVWNVFG